jgi:hypothetical protein
LNDIGEDRGFAHLDLAFGCQIGHFDNQDSAIPGGEIIPDPLLAHLAPVGWQHINLTGDYLWSADAQLPPDGFRQLRAPTAITAHAA